MTDKGGKSLSASNLGTYHHFNCDLYLHNVYHGLEDAASSTTAQPRTSAISQARFSRGLSWEHCLIDWLDNENLLVKVDAVPKSGDDIKSHIDWDERSRFFIAGLAFWPPQEQFDLMFQERQKKPVNFGLMKPDLLEIVRVGNGVKVWRVIDAKASSSSKTSHHVQIYLYTLCLRHILPLPEFQSAETAAVWLPPAAGFENHSPSFMDLKFVDTSLLSLTLDTFLFQELPHILNTPRGRLMWHFNPHCFGCPYTSNCGDRVVEDGRLGSISNVTLGRVKVLENMLMLWRSRREAIGPRATLSDIEDLSNLFNDEGFLERMSLSHPVTLRKAKRALAMSTRSSDRAGRRSSLVEAARTKEVQIIPRRNVVLTKAEDITIVLSLFSDPSSSTERIVAFYITIFTESHSAHLPKYMQGGHADLIPSLAGIIRTYVSFDGIPPSVQFYVFSSAESVAFQSHLVHMALSSAHDEDDIRLCIGALAQGASLLQTAFQPPVLEHVLLGFLGTKQRRREDLVACLERMGLSTSGDMDELRWRIKSALERVNSAGYNRSHAIRRECVQFPCIVVLKSVIERSLALPIAGFWDLSGCARLLTPSLDITCPTDEHLYSVWRSGRSVYSLLHNRNRCIFQVLCAVRNLLQSSHLNILVRSAKPLFVNFIDLCRDDLLRKLFYMQQFEVLAKLSELWNSRVDGCPDAPVVEYRSTRNTGDGAEYVFHLKSGSLDAFSTFEKDKHFFRYIMVPDDTEEVNELPPEILFDDLGLAGLVLSSSNVYRWKEQHPLVQKNLVVADIYDMSLEEGHTQLLVRVWPTAGNMLTFVEHCHYRLSPRFVDFNTTKVLSTLFELDLRSETSGCVAPFLQVVKDPRTFQSSTTSDPDVVHLTRKMAEAIEMTLERLRDEVDAEHAGPLCLKPSQRRATMHILEQRLSVIWGPPGTGKTHTVALSLLRLLNVQYLLGNEFVNTVFITAVTHAAIDALLNKLRYLIECCRSIRGFNSDWVDALQIEHVISGRRSSLTGHRGIKIFVGTIYQLYNLAKESDLEVDLILIDESGQLALNNASLVLRALRPTGKVVLAGDQEQLSPIFSAQYPTLESGPLFCSVLDRLLHFSMRSREPFLLNDDGSRLPSDSSMRDNAIGQGSVVQLEENFRLDPGLGEFIEIIYSRAFVPQKNQTRQLGIGLQGREYDRNCALTLDKGVVQKARSFLGALSCVLNCRPQTILSQPAIGMKNVTAVTVTTDGDTDYTVDKYLPVSLTLVRLKVVGVLEVTYEAHVKAEAILAAALVLELQQCLPEEDIFVATPHRLQRQAVQAALKSMTLEGHGDVGDFSEDPSAEVDGVRNKKGKVVVDTVERLQGSEAAFVIGLFSLPTSDISSLKFMLDRRRLNVAISRAKMLCILISSSDILRPSVQVLADPEASKGFAFLKHYEDRAWSMDVEV
ncbi:hypothetical protein AAF712_012843 [Marasmius tenuissimus]|uniref:DNA2/NAM7 helicase-like C-terminal domain-containing protein n=1 Tax=Marasmius tenuissimus TaxID=585030 RepID=A0ABR2ZFG4_9AGAR